MVTAATGTTVFVGRNTGRRVAPSIYVSDVAAALVTFNASGPAVAGSPTYFQFPQGDVYDLKDISINAQPTVAVTITPLISGQPTGLIILDATIQSTLANRAFPAFAVPGGAILTMVQN